MSDQFFHGARVTDNPNGYPSISTVNASVFGLLCTAPDSEGAATASVSIGSVAANNALTFTAKNAGVNGNKISVSLVNPAASSQVLSVTVSGMAVIVNLATDEVKAITSTAAQVMAAVIASAPASALVIPTATGASTGAGVVTSSPIRYLSGGLNEAFPLNTPVAVIGDPRQAARMGTKGTGPAAIADIFAQAGAVVVVVRVAEGVTDAETLANMIGGVDPVTGAYTGAYAFLSAESTIGLRPLILIAPGYTSQVAFLSSFVPIAIRLRAHIIAEGPDTTDADAFAYTQNFGVRQIFLVDPGVKNLDANGNEVIRPNSPTVAGLIARVDATLGWHWSPSNQEIFAITGTTRPVDYTEADADCRANVLNSQNIATIIRRDGFRLWGNRTLSADPRYAFFCISRVNDIIALSIQRTVNAWAVDRPISKTFFSDLADEVKAYLATLQNQGIIAGGTCYPDPTLNSAGNIVLGKVYFDYDWSGSYPAEDIEIENSIVQTYLTDLSK